MQDSPKRNYSHIEMTNIFRVYSEKFYQSSGRITSQLHAKESEDILIAENYYYDLVEKLTDTNVYLEQLFINNDNEIVVSNIIKCQSL